MSADDGIVTAESRGHVLVITVDREAKRNGFTPEMMQALSTHLTELDESDDLWVGVVTFAGAHTTAGLDLPRFAGAMQSGGTSTDNGGVDPFGMRRRCRKPLVMAVQGMTFTIGIEMMLAADIVIAADDCRFAQLEPKRGLAVFGGAHVRYVERAGWGNAMYHLLRADEFDAERALQLGFVQEIVPAGTQRDRALAVAGEILECAPIAVQEIKRAARVFAEHGEAAGLAEVDTMRDRTANSEDFAEGPPVVHREATRRLRRPLTSGSELISAQATTTPTRTARMSNEPDPKFTDEYGFTGPLPVTSTQRVVPTGDFPPGLPIGAMAPDFELSDHRGETVSFHADRAGARTALLFYRSAVW